MQSAETLRGYQRELDEALNDEFLRAALDAFAKAYPVSRARAFEGLDADALVRDVARIKDQAAARRHELLETFTERAREAGVTVHFAHDAAAARTIIRDIARDTGSKKIIKSKSMTAEEIHLNQALEEDGARVAETDLGEWIIQLRREGPSHMVMPAIHLSRFQVGGLFEKVTGREQDPEIEKLVKVARHELRRKFMEADMGVSGANFAIAETGTIGLVTNEGNGRMVTTLPRVHVALFGLDKLLPSMDDALKVLKVLPRNATGQIMTSYVTWITGAGPCAAAKSGSKDVHFVILDNGRDDLARDPVFSQVLRCVRCGACANVCPVYRLVGGHRMGHIYIGAIGLILTYFFSGSDKARNLVQNCINCGACKEVCAGGIDLPRLIQEIRARMQEGGNRALPGLLLARVMRDRTLFHKLLRTARWAQKPVKGKRGFLRHLPMIFAQDPQFRPLPAIAEKSFRQMWPDLDAKEPATPPSDTAPQVKTRIGLFAGCVQDFVYPEQLLAATDLCRDGRVAVSFPMDQSCCGLPLTMMGEKTAARDVARQNILAFDALDLDRVVTLCASCASHLKYAYPELMQGDPEMEDKARKFADKVTDFSSFARDVLALRPGQFAGCADKAAYHAPCHLCRGLGVREAPRELIKTAGLEYAPSPDEEVCCGFGGTFSMKFPHVSAELLHMKLDNVERTGARLLLTDCPGCVMQLRGGLEARGSSIRVMHVAEALAMNKKPGGGS